jgi:hypothetical protein
MHVGDILHNPNKQTPLSVIRERCSVFLKESKNQSILKNLPKKYDDLQKVKVRTHKSNDHFTDSFNHAFETEHHKLRQRSIFANGEVSFEPANPPLEPFYIFPTDGYKFLYSREVENSSNDYKHVFESIFEEFGEIKGKRVVADVLNFTYCSEQLTEGIISGAEIIIYNIPFYYAIRPDKSKSYHDLLSQIQ